MKKAFTLAEVMIVLTIIGILTAILLPNAFQVTPDEAVLKFKKANATFGNVIRELVYSDKYYSGGDLGKKADGSLIDGTDDSSKRYFCETFADIVSYKKKDCSTSLQASYKYIDFSTLNANYTAENVKTLKDNIDTWCKATESSVGAEIVTSDGTSWWQASPATTFGSKETVSGTDYRFFADPSSSDEPHIKDKKTGFDGAYKVICFDVDEVGQDTDPFGYGVRADGKLLPSTRVDEYLEKSIQREK